MQNLSNFFFHSWGYKENIENWVFNLPKGKGIHANWVLGNHDNQRVSSRWKPSRTDIFNILLKTLPGITITYYVSEMLVVLFHYHSIFSLNAILMEFIVRYKG